MAKAKVTARTSAGREDQSLVVYKDDAVVVTGDKGTASAVITGLAAGTQVSAGTYKVAFKGTDGESDKVNVPAFEVPAEEGQ